MSSKIGFFLGIHMYRIYYASGYQTLINDQEIDESKKGKHSYSNTNYLLLGAIIEKKTEMKFDVFMKEFFENLKMEQTSYSEFKEDEKGLAVGFSLDFPEGEKEPKLESTLSKHMKHGGPDGGCISTTSDLLKFCQYCLSKVGTDKSLKAMEALFPGFGVEEEKGYLQMGHDGAFEGATTSVNMYPKTGETFIVLSNLGNGRQLFTKAIQMKFESLMLAKSLTLQAEHS